MNNQGSKKRLLFILSLIVLLIIMILALGMGSVEITASQMKSLISGEVQQDDPIYQIFYNIRVPRMLMALLVGSALAVSGALLQAVMQNPLADPGIIGVTSGASLAAIIILILLPQYSAHLPIFAFLGAMLACLMVYIMAYKNGEIKPARLILSGVAINSLFGGANSLISVLNSDKIQSVILWINGSLASSSWHDVNILYKYAIIGLIASLFYIRLCNLMFLGDEKVKNLRINIRNARIILSVLGAYLAGVSTALVGSIGFIGLIIPHICRLLVGSDYKSLIPFSIVNGGAFLLMADTFARIIVSPIELPVGTLMSVLGAPFFLYLLRRQR